MKTAYAIAEKLTKKEMERFDMNGFSISKNIYVINNDEVDFEGIDSDKEIILNFGRVLKNTGKGDFMDYCFHYALKTKKLCEVEDGVYFIQKNFIEVNFSDIQKGDIVLFGDDCNYLHFAIIDTTSNLINDVIVRGKFGELGIYRHTLGNTPNIYGNFVSFWRRK
jgi:hypothetical protein